MLLSKCIAVLTRHLQCAGGRCSSRLPLHSDPRLMGQQDCHPAVPCINLGPPPHCSQRTGWPPLGLLPLFAALSLGCCLLGSEECFHLLFAQEHPLWDPLCDWCLLGNVQRVASCDWLCLGRFFLRCCEQPQAVHQDRAGPPDAAAGKHSCTLLDAE